MKRIIVYLFVLSVYGPSYVPSVKLLSSFRNKLQRIKYFCMNPSDEIGSIIIAVVVVCLWFGGGWCIFWLIHYLSK